jgi:hypothetical protein
MKKQFKTGQQVRIKGLKDKFRFVKNNVVRNIKTGHFMAVNPDLIREKTDFADIFDSIKWIIIILITVLFWAAIFILIF